MKTRYIPPSTSIHSDRLERFLGAEKVAQISRNFRHWYGPPTKLIDVPGNVWVHAGGDFSGSFSRGYFASAQDAIFEWCKRLWRESGHTTHGQFATGFTSISDALARASGGFSQNFNGMIAKSGPAGVVGGASSLWRVGTAPAAGAAGSAAPGGRACSESTTGAMVWDNPAAGSMRLVGADMLALTQNQQTLILYDRIFDVAKTMNSTAAEAVTGVPTRFQSTTTTSEDYIGGNFVFPEIGGTALAATAHNWASCTYTDQGNAASTLPTVTGNSAGIVDRLDIPTGSFFCPLESGDSGIKALTNIQCSAAVATGAVNFVIGHVIGIMSFPIANMMIPHDWLTNRKQTPYIPNDACLALLQMTANATATTYSGQIYGTSTAS